MPTPDPSRKREGGRRGLPSRLREGLGVGFFYLGRFGFGYAAFGVEGFGEEEGEFD